MTARKFRSGITLAAALAATLLVQPLAAQAQGANAQPKPATTARLKPGQISDQLCLATFLWAAEARPREAEAWLAKARFLGRKFLSGKSAADKEKLEAAIQTDKRWIAAGASTAGAGRYNNDLRACGRWVEDAEGFVPQAEPGTAERLLAEAEALAKAEKLKNKTLSGEKKEAVLSALHSACRLGLAQACIRYREAQGMSSFFGAADAIREEGFALARACDLGDGEGCVMLGKHHDPAEMLASAKDFPAAIAAYRRACDTHSLADACAKASDLLRSDRNPKPDLAQANAYLIKAQKLRGVKQP
ncbi:hypothetical protein [Porphyrobacter sp. HT-58-2]|uniref:hypothetical protein n=1 Tax=Porphyrobacter sp. HT-58-2 TaxID=2023229 RepID=UPI0011B0C93A|nr:hypothetical protein [Porphyrobacter sp. HT-58-2]